MDRPAVPEDRAAELVRIVMNRQRALSLRVAAAFVLILFGLPLINHLFPDAANRQVFGFTATWLFLGVLFYPFTWLLSWYFIRESDRLEADSASWRSLLQEAELRTADESAGSDHLTAPPGESA